MDTRTWEKERDQVLEPGWKAEGFNKKQEEEWTGTHY